MIRGTTPTHIFTLPFGVETIKTVQVIYRQSADVKITKSNSAGSCALSGNTVTTKLTQEETLGFDCTQPVEIQIRVLTKDGEAMASRKMIVKVDECLSDEVLA